MIDRKLTPAIIKNLALSSSTVQDFIDAVEIFESAEVVEDYEFDHVAIPVSDIEGALEWCTLLFEQIEVLYKDEEWAFIKVGGLKLAFVNEGIHPAHVAFKVSEDMLHLLAEEFDVEIEKHRPDTLSIYVEGSPDKICIEFVHYLKNFNED